MIACAVAIVPMAKPSFIRAEQPLAPDLASDRTLGGGATSRSRDIVFVVNPRGLSQLHTHYTLYYHDVLLRSESC